MTVLSVYPPGGVLIFGCESKLGLGFEFAKFEFAKEANGEVNVPPLSSSLTKGFVKA
jgi:hypothetical protein